MTVKTHKLTFSTRGYGDTLDITRDVQQVISQAGWSTGIVTVFVPGSTAGLTTIEYEDGAVQDFKRLFEEIASSRREYSHNARWGDGNGFSHVRAALLGPSLTVPFTDGRLVLGTWQQVVLVDFDNRGRQRNVVLQVMGE